MTDHPIVVTDFKKYIGTPLQENILPIIPNYETTQLKDTSGLTKADLGKIPGRYHSDEGVWTGFGHWSSNRATKAQLERWDMWQLVTGPIAMGFILGDEIIAIDIDSDDPVYVAMVRLVADRLLGVTPVVRCRDGAVRVQLFYRRKYHTPPITKRSALFMDKAGTKFLTEVLGRGQHTVIEGPHAKGKMHYWENGKDGGLIENADAMPEVTIDQTDALITAIAEESERMGLTKVKMSLPTAAKRAAAAVSISSLMSPHIAKDPDLLAKAIAKIDINSPKLADYDRWCTLFRAMWAACAGNRQFYDEHIWPWLSGNPANTEEDMESKLASFADSQVGAECVYEWAAQFGFTDAINALNQARAVEIFKNIPTMQDTAVVPEDGAANNAAGNGGQAGPGGPTPFPYTDLALADRFAAEHPDWKFTPDEGWMRLQSGVYAKNPNIIDPVGRMCSTVGDPYRAQGGQQVGIDIAMKGQKTHARVEQKLRSHPAMFARPEDFDTDPWLINTPDFIMDLRTGETLDHQEALKRGVLMRYQTAVTPDVLAYKSYESACPGFLEVLHNMTEDEEDIALLGRHGAAGLVGTDLDQLLLLIYGQGGTGKSAFSDILMRVDGSYSTAGSNTLFMKQNDKRPFELGDIAHARSLFVPETLKGMTWDDALICSLLGGVPVRVERKHRDSKKARVFMTITITGNHLPHFITSSEPNKSGIDRRLLLLKVNKILPKVDVQYIRNLVSKEGPAILMWLIQHAMEGWEDMQGTGSFYGKTIKKAKALAEAYKQKMSPHLQWIEEQDVVLESGAHMNAHEAWRSYKEWVKDDNPLHRETKAEFRDNLTAATKGAVTYGRFGDERVLLGMRFKSYPVTGNVVPFPPGELIKGTPADVGGDAKN